MPRQPMHRIGTFLSLIARILLGAVFIYASWEKIADPTAFGAVIANYQILPPQLVDPTALFLPWLELVCGICLIVNRWAGGSALIIAGLLIVFMMALGYNIYRGIDVNCGCFTLAEQAPGNMWLYLARDAALLAVAAGLIRYGHRKTAVLESA